LNDDATAQTGLPKPRREGTMGVAVLSTGLLYELLSVNSRVFS
jgi:hypothetical protein